jgi:hypothetical protein
MEDGTLTFSGACMENGDEPDGVIEQIKKDTKKLLAAGITPPWLRNPDGGGTSPIPNQPSEELAALAANEGIDLPTAMQAKKTGAQRGTMETAISLNGAQITAALDVMNKLSSGNIEPTAATELLVAVGIDRAKAEAMVKATPKGEGKSASDLDYYRTVVEKLLAYLGTAGVVANGIQIMDLIKAAGLPVNTEYKDPYVPVVAPPGNLVSGKVLKDSDGDVVGAEELPPSPAPSPAPAPAQQPGDANPETDNPEQPGAGGAGGANAPPKQ